jgi:rhamnogalacturonyl hydrolase YesR
MALRHMKFMLATNLRPDGLHAHSPLDSAPWGRGNGFPALGLAWCLSHLPESAAERKPILSAHRAHLSALIKRQDPTGMWHQVIDHTGSYREFTSTCMITYSIIRGIRRGWLDEKTYGPVVARSWPAIKTRIASDATLVDVCTGTGKQKTLRAYLDRTAILGPDDRGGAMALMVSTEMAAWDRDRQQVRKSR